jgi:hypothetical protein
VAATKKVCGPEIDFIDKTPGVIKAAMKSTASTYQIEQHSHSFAAWAAASVLLNAASAIAGAFSV